MSQRWGWNDQWPDFVYSLDFHGVLDRDIGKVLPLLERLELEGRLGSAALTQYTLKNLVRAKLQSLLRALDASLFGLV